MEKCHTPRSQAKKRPAPASEKRQPPTVSVCELAGSACGEYAPDAVTFSNSWKLQVRVGAPGIGGVDVPGQEPG